MESFIAEEKKIDNKAGKLVIDAIRRGRCNQPHMIAKLK
jgi:hypothetical protein